MGRFRKLIKYALRLLLVLLAAPLLGLLLIQLPAVQSYLTGELSDYLRKKLQTEVRIDAIRLRLPASLAFRGVYLADRQRDTLLDISELALGFRLSALFRKRVHLTRLRLEGGALRLITTEDSLSNLAFVGEAFGVSPDTSAQDLEKESPTWQFLFDQARLSLRNIRLQYANVPRAMDLACALSHLEAGIREIDLVNNRYHVESLIVAGLDGDLNLGRIDTTAAPSTSSVNYDIVVTSLDLRDIALRWRLADQHFQGQFGSLSADQASFQLAGDDIDLTVPSLILQKGRFRYDDARAPARSAGFDPHHLDLQDLALDIGEGRYRGRELHARIRNFAGRDGDAFVLQNLQTQLIYSPEKLALDHLELLTSRSKLQIGRGYLDFDRKASAYLPADWPVTVNWDFSQLDLADVGYFYSALSRFPYARAASAALSSRGSISGSLGSLMIDQFEVRNRDIQLDLAGRLTNVTTPSNLGIAMEIRRLSSTRQGLTAWLPVGLLPAYVHLPERGSLRGSINGKLQNMRIRLRGETWRGPTPVPAHLAATLQLEKVTDPENARFDIQLDSFFITRADLLAYLPPALLPATADPPESLRLVGGASGRLASFETDLHLRTYRGKRSTSVRLTGHVDSILAPAGLRVDLTLDFQGLYRSEWAAWAPPALLPAHVMWPELERLQVELVGGSDSLAADLRFSSNLGSGYLAGTFVHRKEYDLKAGLTFFRAAEMFDPGYLDSLLGFTPTPLNVLAQLTGKGFDTSKQTIGHARLNLWKYGNEMESGLDLRADLREGVLQATVETREPGLGLSAKLALDYGTEIPQADLFILLQELDLQELKMSGRPIQLSGRIEANMRGFSPDTLMGRLIARDWSILYDSSHQRIDSLWLTARMDHEDNLFQVSSDLLNARLDGHFRISRAVRVLQQQLLHYWDAGAVDSLVGRTPDHFHLDLEICRPELLTMGFISGLQELAPMQWSMQYDNRREDFQAMLSIPHLRWREVQLEAIKFIGTASRNDFAYQLDIRNVDIRQVARVPAMRWKGHFGGDRLFADFIALDAKEQQRFALKTELRRYNGQVYELRLDPRQLLDYEWWQVSDGNLITYHGKKLRIADWRLSRNRESVEIREITRDSLQVLFQHFDLDLLANVLDQQHPYLAGVLNGAIAVAHPLAEPEMEANLAVDSLSVFSAALGDLVTNSRLNGSHLEIALTLQGQGNDLGVAGRYGWRTPPGDLDFQVDLRRVNLVSLEPLAFGYVEKLQGALLGRIELTGTMQEPKLKGEVHFDSTAFDVGLLNTRLKLGSQPVVFDDRGVSFQNLDIFDTQGQRGVVAGRVLTGNYRSFDLNTDLQVANFEVLNTSSADNDLYYGRLVVDARALLRGTLSRPEIEVFARPRRGSQLTYVYRSGAPAVESWQGVVEFVSEEKEKKDGPPPLTDISGQLNTKVTVKMEVTENLSFKAITNPLTNDYFEGKAQGDLNFTQFPDGRMELTGELEMVEGRYLFTYQEVVRRNFAVEKGSTIRWTGDPLNPEMNIKVTYEVETSPAPLLAQFGGAAGDWRSNRKETFRVNLQISGSPAKTEIETSVAYPEMPGNSGNAEVRNCVQRINRDPSQQNTQAFALILFNGFIGAGSDQTDFQIADLDLEGNFGNLITQQLNNLANRYIKFVELDIDLENYERKGAGLQDTRADFRVSLRKQFLNNRLSISLDGVASAQTESNVTNTAYYLDNLTFEYDLTPDGRFRLKVYNRRDYDDIISGNTLKVGGALVFSKDFNEIRLGGKVRKD